MEQERIGKFIARLRKEKSLTQKDLANKLNVSVNAVSKWERGICLMDMSLLKPLSEILDVSIQELLSGEKLDTNNINKIVEDAINYSNNKIKENKKRIIKRILIIIISLVLLIIIGYKSILLYNINFIKSNIIENGGFHNSNYNDKLSIMGENADNYYTFKDMLIENIFDKSINKTKRKYNEVFEFANNKKIYMGIEVNEDNYFDNLNYNNIVNYKKYIQKYNLNNENEIYKFLANFKEENVSIFSPISKLKDYLFKLDFYSLEYTNFDDYYELNVYSSNGSFDGNLIKRNNLFTCTLNGYYNKYNIIFSGFTLDEAIDIISTVNFVE